VYGGLIAPHRRIMTWRAHTPISITALMGC